MTTTPIEPELTGIAAGLAAPRLPRIAVILTAVLALAVSGLLALLLGWGIIALLVVAVILFDIGLPVWSRIVEGARYAADRLTTCLVYTSFLVVLVPLVWLIGLVLKNGLSAISVEFLTYSMRGVVGEGGGIYHALMGTLLVTLATAIISVPIGIFAAIYLVEYGKGNRLARTTTFLVDVMTGIPSIVAGLFALSLFVIIFGPAIRIGFAGSVALSLLMIPTVVRSTEEMLRLVPSDLREASYALGISKWRTIVKVVLPTAVGGIVTGVVLAISRVIGETAPLLVVAGATDSVNMNLFSGRMMTLPVYIFQQYSQPGIVPHDGGDPPGYARAWGAALVLIVLVMLLNLIARIIGKIFAPKTDRRR
ncbi:phosphate ABC transporter permease [Nocardioides sp. Root1257]|uniref:phosphate ABC transporter permease PstA n=1 Tax=unclassified Nocardioides TaxID=2615069 RepID=UPI0006F9028B|nr:MULTISPECIES: phosphate ABC transporter permease PstA [unclassified Nocardioides]KQW48516.1 phosphate ABC transporter permease [Nocardioides sp. Root1257]KRC47692.1 phosphate ABC transporter permease [Nocardioides sp. Root224]